jgi:hypothetical protein
MYTCTKVIIEGGTLIETFNIARRLIDEERENAKGYKIPFIKGHKTKIKYYINVFHRHFDEKEYTDVVGRYRLTPCVFELLRFTKDKPEFSEGKNYYLLGMSGCGKDFKVIVRKKGDGYVLRTYFRV